MKKTLKKSMAIILATLMLLTAAPLAGFVGIKLPDFGIDLTADAATSGYYTYSVENGEATITDVDTSISGDITVPTELGGTPVTKIAYRAFYDCDNITSLIIPDSVVAIYGYAFGNCISLESVVIGDGVTLIADYAFYFCDSLKNVVIGDSLTTVKSSMFYLCTAIENLTIGKAASSIDLGYGSLQKLTSITVDSENPYYSTDKSGVLFNKDKTKIVQYPEGRVTEYTIPASVTTIGRYAFSFNGLSDITIPDNVTSIESGAFAYSLNLTAVTVPGSVKTIGESAFASCDSLKEVIISDDVVTISKMAFYDCASLENISVPRSVTTIGDYAFGFCSNIKSFSVDENNSNYSNNEQGVLFNKDKTQLIQYTTGSTEEQYAIPDTVTSIGDYAFTSSSYLKSVIIPVSVKTIGDSAFYYFLLTDAYYMGSEAEWNSISIASTNNALLHATIHYDYCEHEYTASVTEPTCIAQGYTTYTCECGDTYVADYVPAAHNYVDGVCSVCGDVEIIASGTCGENLTWTLDALGTLTITGTGDMYNYEDSTDMPWYDHQESVKQVVIEDGVASIGKNAFSRCTSLTSVTIPDSVTSIGYDAFFYCESLTSVTIPDSVTSIGRDAFYKTAYYNNTSNWTEHVLYISNHLVAADNSFYDYVGFTCEVREGTKTIADEVFSRFSSLNSISIPASVTNIGVRAFCGNPFSWISVSADNEYYSSSGGILYNKDKTILICCPSDRFDGAILPHYIIPDSVTTIEAYAFDQCYWLEVVKIPSSVTNIGKYAFWGCSLLSDVHYADSETKWRTIEIDDNNDDLLEANIHFTDGTQTNPPEEDVIASGLLGDNLTWTLDSDGTLTVSGKGAMPAISSGSKQPWAEYIGKIVKIIAEPGITVIPAYSFEYCEFAGTIVLPETLTSLHLSAFNDCGSLNNLLIPASVISITGHGNNGTGFIRCESLTDVYYLGTEKEWNTVTAGQPIVSYNSKMKIHYLQFNATTATCTQEGIQAYYQFEEPSVYGPLYDENKQPITQLQTVPALGHSYNAVITAPTCEDGGYTTYTCANCGDSYVADETAATGHAYVGTVTTPPTCTADGVKTFVCSNNADHTYTEPIAKLGHTAGTAVMEDKIEATCTVNGSYNMVVYCATCGEKLSSTAYAITAHGHTPGADATCTEDQTCTICGDVLTDKLGHDYKAVVTAPTCEDGGYTTYTCASCGDSYVADETAALGHSAGAAATCTEDQTCTVCGETLTAAFGHTYVGTVTTNPTCTEVGVKTYVCSNDASHTYTEAVAATGHDYNTVVTAPTCTEQGYTTYTCTTCGDSYVTDYVSATGHSHKGAVTTPATHLNTGVKTYTCECGDTYTEVIAKTAKHTYTAEVLEEAQCKKAGKMLYTCECGDSYTEKIDELGHIDVDDDSSCDRCGIKVCSCMCHQTGFMGFIWKIVKIFWKLFGMNPVCECGKAHY